MRKRLVFSAVFLGMFLFLSALSYIIFDFYFDVKDYIQTLAVKREPAASGMSHSDTALVEKQALDVCEKESRLVEEQETEIFAGDTNTVPDAVQDKGNQGNEPGNKGVSGNVINILFVGLDRTVERDKTLGIYRSDTMAVARIDLDAKTVDVLSIPRDTYTYIPATERMDKINHAYAFGSIENRGNESAVEAVEHFIKYGNIDYYFTIEMEPIPEIVDLLGGVEIDVEAGISNLPEGRQILNGEQALSYIRWRYSGDGDIGRIKRQQKFILAMLDKLRKTDQLMNAVKIVLSYNKNVSTNMSIKQIASLAVFAGELSGDSINFHIVPGNGEKIGGVWYWVPDREKTQEMLSDIFLPIGVDICLF